MTNWLLFACFRVSDRLGELMLKKSGTQPPPIGDSKSGCLRAVFWLGRFGLTDADVGPEADAARQEARATNGDAARLSACATSAELRSHPRWMTTIRSTTRKLSRPGNGRVDPAIYVLSGFYLQRTRRSQALRGVRCVTALITKRIKKQFIRERIGRILDFGNLGQRGACAVAPTAGWLYRPFQGSSREWQATHG